MQTKEFEENIFKKGIIRKKMKKWQIKNSEKLEISGILEELLRIFSFHSFRFYLTAKTENSNLKILQNNFRDLRDFQGFQA